jgi:hypothetical protein
MTRSKKVPVVCVLALSIVLPALGGAQALNNAAFGIWSVDYDNADSAQPHYDAAWVRGFYNTKPVEWLYKTKFIEVGERKAVGGQANYGIEWTRFDMALAAVVDQRVGQTSFRYVASGGAYGCYDVIEAKYEGTYTQQDGAVQGIQFTQLFKYIRASCDGWADNNYFYDATASSMQGTDSFFWRIVTVQNPDLGAVNCVTTAYNNYNGAAAGTMVTIGDNSVGPTPTGNVVPHAWATAVVGGVVRTLKYNMPVDANNRANDLIATTNINLDTRWFFDRGVGEILHDASATENGGNIADTTCVNLVVMFEYQTYVFYNLPSSSYSVLTRHTLQGY